MSPTITELKKYFKEKSELGVLFEVIISKFENFGHVSGEHFMQTSLSHYKTCCWNSLRVIFEMFFISIIFVQLFKNILSLNHKS